MKYKIELEDEAKMPTREAVKAAFDAAGIKVSNSDIAKLNKTVSKKIKKQKKGKKK